MAWKKPATLAALPQGRHAPRLALRSASVGHVLCREEVPPALASLAIGLDALVGRLLKLSPVVLEVVVMVAHSLVTRVRVPAKGILVRRRKRLILGTDGPGLGVLREGLRHKVAGAVASGATFLCRLRRECILHVEDPPDQVLRLRRRHRRARSLSQCVADSEGPLFEHGGTQRLQLRELPQLDDLAVDGHLPGSCGRGMRVAGE
mmetsp:Transcript_56685/g.122022  ORF Transcript_56685/g.122022 Transcript_56685/m.122022 type:complete len:205 (+) Transcript_56685:390-1004(+)